MSQNLSVFHDFKNSLKNPKQLANGNWMIRAKVIYKWDGRVEEEMLFITLTLHGMGAGSIEIDQGKIINSDNVHTGFNSQFSNPILSLDANVFLSIKGKANAHFGGHNYEVMIIPLE